MNVLAKLLCAIPVLLATAGCAVMPPAWCAPGPAEVQRQAATLHDPYADNDMAPEIVGGRPREFDKPLAEPVRNRLLSDTLLGF